jgi:hypothetical protein
MKYAGSCHCGAVKFTLDIEPITSGVRCNCSMCRRKSAVMSELYFTSQQMTIALTQPLGKYVWGDRTVNNFFCTTCGIYTFHEPIDEPGTYRVNLGCIDGIDPLALPIRSVDGASY